MSKRESAINKYRRHHFGDWAVMTGRRACTFADQGVLLKAIDLYWRFGCEGLPAKTNELAELLDCDPEEAQSMLEHTVGHFTDGDSIHWDSIRDQYTASSEFAKSCVENGGKGGRAPRRSDCLANANQTLSQPVTISQEPLTIVQEPECVSTVEEAILFKAAKQVRE